jgi:hypothetical protein
VASEADLQEVNGAASAPSDAEVFYREALGWYASRWPRRWNEKQKSARWAAWMWTREKFELTAVKPPSRYWNVSAMTPGHVTAGWLKSRMIAWAKQRQREKDFA